MDYPYIVEGNPENINIIDAIANKFFNLSTPSPEQRGSNLNEESEEGHQDENRSFSPKPTSSNSSQHIIPESCTAEEEGIQWDNSDNLLGVSTPIRLSPTAEYDYVTPLDVGESPLGDDLLSGLSGVRSFDELEGEAHDGVKFPLMAEPHELQDSDEGPPHLEDSTKISPPRRPTEESEALGPPPLEPMTISSSDQIANEEPNLSKHLSKEISSDRDANCSNNTVLVCNGSIKYTEHLFGSKEKVKHIVPITTITRILKNHQNDVDSSLDSPLQRLQKETTDNKGLECSSLASDGARKLLASNEGTGHSFSKTRTPLKPSFNNISPIKSGISPDVPSKEDIELIIDVPKSGDSDLNGYALLSPDSEIRELNHQSDVDSSLDSPLQRLQKETTDNKGLECSSLASDGARKLLASNEGTGHSFSKTQTPLKPSFNNISPIKSAISPDVPSKEDIELIIDVPKSGDSDLNGYALLSPNSEISSPISLEPKNNSASEVVVKLELGPFDRPKFEDLAEENTPKKNINKIIYTPLPNSSNNNYVAVSRRKLYTKPGVKNGLLNVSRKKQSSNKTHIPTLSAVPRKQVKSGTESSRVDMPESSNKVIGQNKDISTSDPCRRRNKKFKVGCDILSNGIASEATRIEFSKETRGKGPLLEQFRPKKSNIEESRKCDSGISERGKSSTLKRKPNQVDKSLDSPSTNEKEKERIDLSIPLDKIDPDIIDGIINKLDSSYVPEIEKRSPIKTPQSGSNNQRADTSPRTGTTADDIVPDCSSQTQPSAAASRSRGTCEPIEHKKKTDHTNKQNQSRSLSSAITCQTITTNKIQSSDPAYMNEKGRRSLNLPGLLLNPKSKANNFISHKVSLHSRSINGVLYKSNKNRSRYNRTNRLTRSLKKNAVPYKGTVSTVLSNEHNKSIVSKEVCELSIIQSCSTITSNGSIMDKKPGSSSSNVDKLQQEKNKISVSRNSEKDVIFDKVSSIKTSRRKSLLASDKKRIQNSSLSHCKNNDDIRFGLSLNLYESIFPNEVPAKHNFEVQSTNNQNSGESLVENKTNQNVNTNKEGSLFNSVQSTDKKFRTVQAKDGSLLEPTKELGHQNPVELRSNAELGMQVKTQELRTPMDDESGLPLKPLVMSTTAMGEPCSFVKLASEPPSKGDEEAKAITKIDKTDSVSSFSKNLPRNNIEEFQGCTITEQNYIQEFCESNETSVNKASSPGRISLDSSSKPKHLSNVVKTNLEEYPGADDKSENHSQTGPSIDMSMAKSISDSQKEIIGLQALNLSLKKPSQIPISSGVKFDEEGELHQTAETKMSKANYEVYQDCLLSKQKDVPIKNSCEFNKISDNKSSTPKGEFLEVSSSNTKLQSDMMLKTDPEYLPGAGDQSDQCLSKPNPDNSYAFPKVGNPTTKQEDAIEHKTVGPSRESFVTYSTEIKISSKFEVLKDELRDCMVSKQHDMSLEGQCESNRISGCTSTSANEKSLGSSSSNTKLLTDILKTNYFEPPGDQSSCKPTAEEISDILCRLRIAKQDKVIDSAKENHETNLEQKRKHLTLISGEVSSDSASKVTETTSSESGNLISEKEQLVSNENDKVLKELRDSDKIPENESSVPEGVLLENNSSDPKMLPDLITLNNEELSAIENQSGETNSKETTEISGIDLPVAETPGETETTSSESGNLLSEDEQLVSKENNKECCKSNKILDNDSPVQEGVPLENNSSETKLLTDLTTLNNEELSAIENQSGETNSKETTEISGIDLPVTKTPGETETTSSESGNLLSEDEELVSKENNKECCKSNKILDNDSPVQEGVLLENNSSDPKMLPDLITLNNEELSAIENQSGETNSKETTEISGIDLPVAETPGETETTSSESGNLLSEDEQLVSKENNKECCKSNKILDNDSPVQEGVPLENNSSETKLLTDLTTLNNEELSAIENQSGETNSKETTEISGIDLPVTETPGETETTSSESGNLLSEDEQLVSKENNKECCRSNKILDNDSPVQEGVPLENNSSETKLLTDLTTLNNEELSGTDGQTDQKKIEEITEIACIGLSIAETPGETETTSSQSGNLISENEHLLCNKNNGVAREFSETAKISDIDSLVKEGVLLGNNSSDPQLLPDLIIVNNEELSATDNQSDQQRSKETTEISDVNLPLIESPGEIETTSSQSGSLPPEHRTTHNIETCFVDKQNNDAQTKFCESNKDSGSNLSLPENVLLENNSPHPQQDLIKHDTEESAGHVNDLDKNNSKPIIEKSDVNSPLAESENISSESVNQIPGVERSLDNIQEVKVLGINAKGYDSRPADEVLLEIHSSVPKQDIIKSDPNNLAGPENQFIKTSSEPSNKTSGFNSPRTEIPAGPETSSKSLNLIPDVDHCKQDNEGPGEYCETQVSGNDSRPPEGALLENNSSDLQKDTVKLDAGLDNQLDTSSSNCSTETSNTNSPGTETQIEPEKVSVKSLKSIPVIEPFLASKQDDKGQVELSDSHEVSGNGSRSPEGVLPRYNSPGLKQALIKFDPNELVGPDNQLDKHSYKSSTITSGFSLRVLETPVESEKSFLKSVDHLCQNNYKSGFETSEIKVPVAETPDETRSSSSKLGDLIQEKEVSSACKQESNSSPAVVKPLDGNFSNPTLHMHVQKIVLEELLGIVDQNTTNSDLKEPMNEPTTILDSLAKQSFERNVWHPTLICDNKKLIFKELSAVPRESSISNAHKAEETTPGSDEVKLSPFINNFFVRAPREQNCLSEKYVPNNFSSCLVNRLSTNESLVGKPLNQPLSSISKRIQVSCKPSHYPGLKSFYLSMDETGTHTLDPENDDIISSVVRRYTKPENSLLEKNTSRRREDEFRFPYHENRRVYENPKRIELTIKNKTKSGIDVQLNQSVSKPKALIADFSSPVAETSRETKSISSNSGNLNCKVRKQKDKELKKSPIEKLPNKNTALRSENRAPFKRKKNECFALDRPKETPVAFIAPKKKNKRLLPPEYKDSIEGPSSKLKRFPQKLDAVDNHYDNKDNHYGTKDLSIVIKKLEIIQLLKNNGLHTAYVPSGAFDHLVMKDKNNYCSFCSSINDKAVHSVKICKIKKARLERGSSPLQSKFAQRRRQSINEIREAGKAFYPNKQEDVPHFPGNPNFIKNDLKGGVPVSEKLSVFHEFEEARKRESVEVEQTPWVEKCGFLGFFSCGHGKSLSPQDVTFEGECKRCYEGNRTTYPQRYTRMKEQYPFLNDYPSDSLIDNNRLHLIPRDFSEDSSMSSDEPGISKYGSFRNSATRHGQTQHHYLSNHPCSFTTKNHEKYTRRKKKRRKIKKEEISASEESEDSGSESSDAQSFTDESDRESERYHFTGAIRKGKR